MPPPCASRVRGSYTTSRPGPARRACGNRDGVRRWPPLSSSRNELVKPAPPRARRPGNPRGPPGCVHDRPRADCLLAATSDRDLPVVSSPGWPDDSRVRAHLNALDPDSVDERTVKRLTIEMPPLPKRVAHEIG